MIAEADKAFGRVDVLVNVAALTDRGTILDTSPELFDRMFAVNVRAPFFLMQDAAKIMRREKIGGADRQHPVDVRPRRPALHLGLFQLEGGARDAHQERRLLADARPYPRQRPQHRLDGHARRARASRCATTPSDADWLKKRREEAALRPPAQAGRGGARRRLSRLRRVRPDDRLDHRLRPAGARLERIGGAPERPPRRRLNEEM